MKVFIKIVSFIVKPGGNSKLLTTSSTSVDLPLSIDDVKKSVKKQYQEKLGMFNITKEQFWVGNDLVDDDTVILTENKQYEYDLYLQFLGTN